MTSVLAVQITQLPKAIHAVIKGRIGPGQHMGRFQRPIPGRVKLPKPAAFVSRVGTDKTDSRLVELRYVASIGLASSGVYQRTMEKER